MRFPLYFIFLFCCVRGFSEPVQVAISDSCGRIIEVRTVEISLNEISYERPNPILKLFQKKIKRTKRLTAAVLAFPFPFGIVGLHRIYLGTEPYVPVAYIGTLGGVFGVIPLIDFFAILFDKDFENYNNNGKVLMWVK